MIKASGNPIARPAAELIRQELERVLGSTGFVKSPALGRLLSFLVQSELAGGALDLKETFVGHALYGRQPTYDPKLDSVVRVNANRLRLRLEEHYRSRPDARLRIALNKGSYVPFYMPAEEGCGMQGTPPDGHLPPGSQSVISAPVKSTFDARANAEHAEPIRFAEPDTLSPSAMRVSATRVAPGVSAASSLPRWINETKLPRFAVALLALFSLGAIIVIAVNHDRVKGVWRARPFSSLEGSQEFSDFSPDGKKIVFSRQDSDRRNRDIYVQGIHGDAPQRLTASTGEDTRPAWSPDGHSIAFIRLLGPNRKELDILSLVTGRETRLVELEGMTPWLCEIPRLSWSRDGADIYASESLGAGQACGIIAVSVGTGDIRPITRPPSGVVADVEPALSPDGTKLAFLRDLGNMGGDIYVVDPEGGSSRRVTFDNRDIMGFCWSNDGTSFIAASRRGDGVVKLWRMPLEGGNPEQLTDGSAVTAFPSASLRGDRIAFTTYRNITSIWSSDGLSEKQLVDNQSGNSAPALSPDGRRLVYRSDRTGPFEFWLIDLDGGDSKRLTHFDGPMVDNPAWSPDGRQIALECRDRGHSDICLVPADGSDSVRHLTHWSSNQILPSWSHDGRNIYYGSNFSGRWEIYKQSIDGGDPIQITRQGGMRAIESWDGRYLYVHRGEPIGGILVLPIGATNYDPRIKSDESTIVLNQLAGGMWGDWDSGPAGIVFLAKSASGNAQTITSLDPITGSSRTLWTFPGSSPEGDRVLSVAPDGNTLFYVKTTAYDARLEIFERDK